MWFKVSEIPLIAIHRQIAFGHLLDDYYLEGSDGDGLSWLTDCLSALKDIVNNYRGAAAVTDSGA